MELKSSHRVTIRETNSSDPQPTTPHHGNTQRRTLRHRRRRRWRCHPSGNPADTHPDATESLVTRPPSSTWKRVPSCKPASLAPVSIHVQKPCQYVGDSAIKTPISILIGLPGRAAVDHRMEAGSNDPKWSQPS